MVLDPNLFPPVAPLSPLVPPLAEARKLPRHPAGGPNVPNFTGPGVPVPVQTPVGLSAGSAPQVPVFDLHRYASIQDGNFPVPNSAAVRVVEQPATRRNFLALRNTSTAANVFVGFGRQASTVSTFILAPGQTLLFDTVVPQNDVWLIADAALATCSVAYSNLPGLG